MLTKEDLGMKFNTFEVPEAEGITIFTSYEVFNVYIYKCK